MKQRIYIETTIPSFYHEIRKEPSMVSRRDWTRDWWDNHRHNYEIVTSEAVLDELRKGSHPKKTETLELIQDIPLAPITEDIVEIVSSYINHHVMPSDPAGDALHLAIASFYKCDFLITWNCKHLANANKYAHIQRVNVMLRLFVPCLVTPMELINEDNEL